MRVLRHKLRKMGKKDLYFLIKYILGYTDLDHKLHRPLCRKIQKVNKYVVKRHLLKSIPPLIRNRLWLVFRGSFKTTILTIGHTTQLILRDPNIRICIASNKLDNAKDMLGSIKQHFMLNPLFRFLYPEFCPQPNADGKIEWGTSTKVTVANRTDLTLKESTIECAGVDTGLTSRHYDYLKKDDLVTDKSVTTEEQIQTSIDWDRLSLSLFNIPEKGFTDWIGTIYHEMDLYMHLLKRPKDQLFRYIKAVVNDIGDSVFPTRFTKHGIQLIREDQGEYIFSCQYLLEPIATKDRRFHDHWFITYDKLPDYYSICILVDPAATRKKYSKYTAMVVHAIVREEGKIKWYLVDGVFDKLSPTQRVDALFRLVRKWKHALRLVSYETIGFQDTDRVNIERKQKEDDFYFSISRINAQAKTKDGRIEGMIPFYENGKVLFPKRLPYYSIYHAKVIDIVQIIKYELLKFPQSEHKDFIDAQSQQLQHGFYPPVKAIPQPSIKPGSFFWYRNKLRMASKNQNIQLEKQEDVWHEAALV